MLKFERLNIVTADKIRKQLTLGIILLVVFLVVLVVAVVFNSTSTALDTQSRKLLEAQTEIQVVTDENAEYASQILDLPIEQSKLTTKEQLVICLGNCAKDAECEITALSNNASEEGQAVTKYNFTFEIKGTLAHLAQTLNNLDTKGVCYCVNSLSLRQEADYLWLQRDISDDITWWDLSNFISGGEQVKTALTSEEILADTAMRFYVNLDFIVINELM